MQAALAWSRTVASGRELTTITGISRRFGSVAMAWSMARPFMTGIIMSRSTTSARVTARRWHGQDDDLTQVQPRSPQDRGFQTWRYTHTGGADATAPEP